MYDDITYPFTTSAMIAPLKFGNEQVSSPYILLYMQLLIHFVIKVINR